MQNWLAWIDRMVGMVLKPVVFAGMAGLTMVITLQIVSRVFFTSVGWTEEVARFLLIWVTFLGATLAFQQGRHIAVTVIADALPPRLRLGARLAAQLIAIAVLVSLSVVGYRYMLTQGFQKSPSLRVSMTYIYSVMPFCTALMALLCITDMLRLVRGLAPRAPQSETPE